MFYVISFLLNVTERNQCCLNFLTYALHVSPNRSCVFTYQSGRGLSSDRLTLIFKAVSSVQSA